MNGSLQPDTLLSERYRILAPIGEGGFGTVYKARDEQQYSKVVAIKEINMAALSAQEKIEVTDTFNREITLLSSLAHKSLPHIHDQFTDPEHWYIAMDYIEGQTLEDLLARTPKGRLPVEQVINIGILLCDVLSYLHTQDPPIIFRDVKPGNIMLTPWGKVYLIDFGIARRYRPGQARDTGPLGSPGYAAPEQYGRAQTTPQTDIYGLGATLQTLLTGRDPLDIRLHGLPPDVYIPQKLQTLLTQMMDPDPARRPQNMEEVKKTLQPLVMQQRSWVFLVYFGFFSLSQAHFLTSPWLLPYLLLALFLLVIPCLYTLIRARRISSAPLSARAILLILGKQAYSLILPLAILSGTIASLYNFLLEIQQHTLQALFISPYPVFFLGFVLIWLKKKYDLYHSQRPTAQRQQQQMPPPQQMQKRP